MIEVKHLTKKYGPNVAVDDISFTVESGRIYGFLGPNGAGKSTTMNIICGCLAATEGEVLVDGTDIYDEPLEVRRKIGYLPEIPPLYPDMTPREYLRFVARAKKVADVESAIDRVVSHKVISSASASRRRSSAIPRSSSSTSRPSDSIPCRSSRSES